MTSLPPDRGHLLTEQRNLRTMRLHELSAAECVRLIHDEDREVLRAMERALPAITAFIEAAEPGFARGGRLVYVGAGTSGRLGVLDASESPPTFQVGHDRVIGIIAGGNDALRRSSESREDDPNGAVAELSALGLGADDAVIGIAAGGTTPFVIGALAFGAGLSPPPMCVLLACAPEAVSPAGVLRIVIETGPEVIAGSTRMKAGTATKLALNTISTTLMVRSGRVYQNLMVDLNAKNAKLLDRAARIVSTLTPLSRDAAISAVNAAGGSVKVAVAMQRLGISREEAERRLGAADGRLHRVIEAP